MHPFPQFLDPTTLLLALGAALVAVAALMAVALLAEASLERLRRRSAVPADEAEAA